MPNNVKTDVKTRVLLVFVDGLGIGPADVDTNPFAAVDCRVLKITDSDGPDLKYGGFFKAIDALLDMPGLPQSATGQTALLTGINASKERGGHLKGFPDDPLKSILEGHSVLKQAVQAGLKVVFANAYRSDYFKFGRLIPGSVTTAASLQAGLRLRNPADVKAGKSVHQEFTNTFLKSLGEDVPILTSARAGEVLARIAAEYDLAMYEYFQSDKAGHSMDRERALRSAEMLDEFLDAMLAEIDLSATLVILTSDHGNLEDISQKEHTYNPVPLMVWGPGAERATEKAQSILDIAPLIRGRLGIGGMWDEG